MVVAKPFEISKEVVWKAYLKVKENRGSAGIDNESLEEFEKNLDNNLYKIWNQMSSGSYFPPAVLQVEIPKEIGVRILGVPAVSDRIAQMVAKMYAEPYLEPIFHPDSYGYRPNKSAIDAIETAKERCWQYNWVLEFDIQKFFDNLDRDLLMKAVERHIKIKWILLYIWRWLCAAIQTKEGETIARNKGVPQGGVISPILANLFLHYAFDDWMCRNFPNNPFERYADDAIIHCKTEEEARLILETLNLRMEECKLQLHPEKTRIVYCKDDKRAEEYENCSFDFLGYTFRARKCRSRWGKIFNGFSPAVSDKAKKKFRKKIKDKKVKSLTQLHLKELASKLNPVIRGWIEYFKHFYPSAINTTLEYVNQTMIRWVRKKFKKLRSKHSQARIWLANIAKKFPTLFAHWQYGALPNGSQ